MKRPGSEKPEYVSESGTAIRIVVSHGYYFGRSRTVTRGPSQTTR
jgi:hypothetical protein